MLLLATVGLLLSIHLIWNMIEWGPHGSSKDYLQLGTHMSKFVSPEENKAFNTADMTGKWTFEG